MKHNIFNTESKQRAIGIINDLSPEKRWVVSVTEQKEKHTDAQRRTIHGWFRYIAVEYDKATGKYYRPASWKIYFKERFGVYVEIETLDGIRMEPKSLSKYTVKELSSLMDNTNHHCGSEFNIFVPIPGEPTDI